MSKSTLLSRRQFLRLAGNTIFGVSAAAALPATARNGLFPSVQDLSLSNHSDGLPHSPTGTTTVSPSTISDDQISFLANHEIIHGDTTSKVALMTYDDANNNGRLNHLMDVYREFGGKMTVFIIGIDLEKCTASLPRLIEEGHELGCHGWTHDTLTALSDESLHLQFEIYTRTVSSILPGYTMKYFRAPYGERNQRVREIAAQWGLQHVLWSLESGGQDKQTFHNVVDRLQPGEIILSHETRYFDVNDAEVIVRELIRKGYSLENITTGMSQSDCRPVS